VKRGGSLSFLVGTISNVLVMEIGWTDVGSGELSYDIGFVYRRTDVRTNGRTDGHGETSIPPYNFVAGGIKIYNVKCSVMFDV
jgi:hypothetical protein